MYFQKYMHISIVSMPDVYACIMHFYACIIHIKYMSEIYVRQKYMYLRNIYMSKIDAY